MHRRARFWRALRGSFVAPLVLMVPLSASAQDEATQFRRAALEVLVKRGLQRVDRDAYVCISVEGQAPSAAEFAQFRTFEPRELGPPSECRCVEAAPHDRCSRHGTQQAACKLDVDGLHFHSFDNANATLTVLCGWPRGGGETVPFVKRSDGWHALEPTRYIKF